MEWGPTTAPHIWMAPSPTSKSCSGGSSGAALLQLKGLLAKRGNDPKSQPSGGTRAGCSLCWGR